MASILDPVEGERTRQAATHAVSSRPSRPPPRCSHTGVRACAEEVRQAHLLSTRADALLAESEETCKVAEEAAAKAKKQRKGARGKSRAGARRGR